MFRLVLDVIRVLAGDPSIHTQAQVCHAFGGMPRQSCVQTLAACYTYDGAMTPCPDSLECSLWCYGVDRQLSTSFGTSAITGISTGTP